MLDHEQIQGAWGSAPLAPKIFFKSYSFQTILGKKPYFEQSLGSGPPLLSKLHWAPLTKILDPPLQPMCHESIPSPWKSFRTLAWDGKPFMFMWSISPGSLGCEPHRINCPDSKARTSTQTRVYFSPKSRAPYFGWRVGGGGCCCLRQRRWSCDSSA